MAHIHVMFTPWAPEGCFQIMYLWVSEPQDPYQEKKHAESLSLVVLGEDGDGVGHELSAPPSPDKSRKA